MNIDLKTESSLFPGYCPAEVSEFLSELEHFDSVLDLSEERGVGVFWVLESHKKANRKGTSLVVVIA